MDYLMEKTQPVELAAAKEVARAAHPTTLLLQPITLVKESVTHSWLLSKTEPDCKAPVEEATTDNVSVPLAPMAAVLATEADKEAVEIAVEAAEAVEAEGTVPAPIVCPLMESMSLIPFAVSPQMNG